jgi:hypothetical protein
MPRLTYAGVTNPAGVTSNKATGGGNTSVNLGTPPTGTEAPTSGGYSGLLDDGTRWTTNSANNYAYEEFRCCLPTFIKSSSVLAINFYWKGVMGLTGGGSFSGGGGKGYIYNFNTAAWEQFFTTTWDGGPAVDQIFSIIKVNPQNYINASNYSYIGVISQEQGDGSSTPSTCKTNYVYFDVNVRAGFFINFIKQ